MSLDKSESIKNIVTQSGRLAASGRSIKVKPLSKSRLTMRITMIALAALTIYGFFVFDYKNISPWQGTIDMLANFKTMFLSPHLAHLTFWEGAYAIVVTLAMAVLTTLISAFLAFFLALFAAQNLSNHTVARSIQAVAAFIRSIPTVLWVLIFAISAGLGSVAAIVGMSFHSISYLTKAYAESFEEMDQGLIEALRATGAHWWHIVFQAVLPMSLTYLISWTFMRFEINFGVSVAMGAAAGAGGIGFDMFMASAFYHDLREVGAITYYILVVAFLLEMLSLRMKSAVRGKMI